MSPLHHLLLQIPITNLPLTLAGRMGEGVGGADDAVRARDPRAAAQRRATRADAQAAPGARGPREKHDAATRQAQGESDAQVAGARARRHRRARRKAEQRNARADQREAFRVHDGRVVVPGRGRRSDRGCASPPLPQRAAGAMSARRAQVPALLGPHRVL